MPVLCIIARASLEKGGLSNDSDTELTGDAALSSTCFMYRIPHQLVITASLSFCVTVIPMRIVSTKVKSQGMRDILIDAVIGGLMDTARQSTGHLPQTLISALCSSQLR